jgi:ABC-type sulfate/molybdate transport systems ATPase subunit
VNAVRIGALAVHAGGKSILGPLTLDVGEREHVLVVGRSGTGKSTLLRAIAGLARPSSGHIELFGQRVSDGARILVPSEARRIGFLFQGGALWPHMSARKQIEFVLRYAGCARGVRATKASELLEWVELRGFEARMPATLSGGEAQRLALARALAVAPRLLLLDEPLGPLDAELREALLTKLRELQERLGLTVIHVTHAPGEAQHIATRVVRLEGGRVAEEGRP